MSNDTDADLTALIADVRAKAEAVPSLYRTGWTYANCGHACCQWLDSDHLAEGHDPLNSPSALTHIARMDPATALRLVDAVERLSGKLAAAEADTARLTRERDDAQAENERLRGDAPHMVTPQTISAILRAEAAEAEVADLRTRLADADAVRDQWKRTAAAHELRANAAGARLADAEATIQRVRGLRDRLDRGGFFLRDDLRRALEPEQGSGADGGAATTDGPQDGGEGR